MSGNGPFRVCDALYVRLRSPRLLLMSLCWQHYFRVYQRKPPDSRKAGQGDGAGYSLVGWASIS
jgi:hypothetical protein